MSSTSVFRMLLTIALGVGVAIAANAEHLGTLGPTYPIAEEDLLTVIHKTLKEKQAAGEFEKEKRAAQERVKQQIENPKPLPGFTAAIAARTFYFDPTFTVPANVYDDKNNVLIAAGTQINPLDTRTLTKTLLFFDARDPAQAAYAKRVIDEKGERVTPILVAGSYMKLMREWKVPIYFDQNGAITSKLGVTRVPTVVNQEGKRLRIDEVLL